MPTPATSITERGGTGGWEAVSGFEVGGEGLDRSDEWEREEGVGRDGRPTEYVHQCEGESFEEDAHFDDVWSQRHPVLRSAVASIWLLAW